VRNLLSIDLEDWYHFIGDPAVRTAGGIAGFYKYPRVLQLEAGPLVELPVSTSRLLGVTTAFCGGGFGEFASHLF